MMLAAIDGPTSVAIASGAAVIIAALVAATVAFYPFLHRRKGENGFTPDDRSKALDDRVKTEGRTVTLEAGFAHLSSQFAAHDKLDETRFEKVHEQFAEVREQLDEQDKQANGMDGKLDLILKSVRTK